MPAHDVSSTADDRSTNPDVLDHWGWGWSRSHISEKHAGAIDEHAELASILRFMDDPDIQWEPVQASHVQDVVEASMPSTEWISMSKFEQWFEELVVVQERNQRILDAMAVLAETVGGVAREWLHRILSRREKHDARINYVFELQALLILIMSSEGAWPDTYWWNSRTLYIPSQGMYHHSYTSSLLGGRKPYDYSPDRPSKDLAEVMRISLPYFREMNARIDALSKLRNVGYSSSSSDSPSIFGPTNMVNLIACLDIAESVAKLVPVFGDVLEGACGILRKTLNAAEVARAARDQCKALAEHTACITLAIINEIGSTSKEPAIPTPNIFDLCATIGEVERRIARLSTLGRFKYLTARGKINAEVKDLRARVDNARIAFKIRSDISTTGLLYDLRMMQTRLASRVEDIYEGQQTTHHMLHTILVEVRGHRSGHAYVEEAD